MQPQTDGGAAVADDETNQQALQEFRYGGRTSQCARQSLAGDDGNQGGSQREDEGRGGDRVVTGPPITPPSPTLDGAAPGGIRRISRSATGPPMMPPMTRPIVAEVIVKPITPRMSCSSAKRSA